MDIGEIISKRRKELDLTLEQVGNFVGVGKSTVKKWESGAIANIKRDKIAKLAQILQYNPVVLINGELSDYYDSPNSKYPHPNVTEDYTTFPVYGDIAAGYESVALEDWEGELIDIPTSYLKGRNRDDFIVLRVKGSSMFPAYQEGDKVLVLKQSIPNYSGQVSAVIYDGEYATLKKVEYTEGENWMRLVPINPNVEPELIEGERLTRCRVIGIPKLLIREVNY